MIPATVANVQPCRASQLAVRASFQGATQSQLGGLRLTNRSTVACALPASPVVTIAWRGRALAIRQKPFPRSWLGTQLPGARVVRVLVPGAHADVIAQWWDWCGARPWGAAFRPTVSVRLTGGGTAGARTTELVDAPICNGLPSILRVSPFLRLRP